MCDTWAHSRSRTLEHRNTVSFAGVPPLLGFVGWQMVMFQLAGFLRYEYPGADFPIELRCIARKLGACEWYFLRPLPLLPDISVGAWEVRLSHRMQGSQSLLALEPGICATNSKAFLSTPDSSRFLAPILCKPPAKNLLRKRHVASWLNSLSLQIPNNLQALEPKIQVACGNLETRPGSGLPFPGKGLRLDLPCRALP